jgi:hypothetical protein
MALMLFNLCTPDNQLTSWPTRHLTRSEGSFHCRYNQVGNPPCRGLAKMSNAPGPSTRKRTVSDTEDDCTPPPLPSVTQTPSKRTKTTHRPAPPDSPAKNTRSAARTQSPVLSQPAASGLAKHQRRKGTLTDLDIWEKSDEEIIGEPCLLFVIDRHQELSIRMCSKGPGRMVITGLRSFSC